MLSLSGAFQMCRKTGPSVVPAASDHRRRAPDRGPVRDCHRAALPSRNLGPFGLAK